MDAIRLHVNDRLVEVRDVPPTLTLLRFLRERLHLAGTKEGCAEGDCGACTIVLLDTDATGDPCYRAVNACLLLLPMVHGRRVYTVEGLARDGLHPAQAALVRERGSQCGYCTPGFVMSMFEAAYRPDLDAPWKLDDQLSGNLCRCTGYRPIKDAAASVAGTRPDDDFRRMLEDAPPEPLALRYAFGEQRYYVPSGFDELFRILEEHDDARVVCGGTDLALEVTQQHRHPRCLVSVETLPGLRNIDEVEGGWRLGAAVSIADLEDFADSELPVLARMLRFFGSRQIKHRGTLGGNICNASPIGDTPPVLLALGATLLVRSAEGERRIPVDEFFVSYRKTALGPGEILTGVEVPQPEDATLLAAYKVSKRRELDISTVSACFAVRVEDGTVREARLAFGGMAAVPARASAAEASLMGRPWEEDVVEEAAARLDSDFTPIDDFRGSAWYRRTVAANLLRGFWLETREEPSPRLPDRPTATVQTEDAP